MAQILTKSIAEQIKKTVYAKADAHRYMSQGRNENGQFMIDLVDDPEVGGVLSSYMGKGEIKTYIKDGILNQYTKSRTKDIHKKISVTDTIHELYSESVSVIPTKGTSNLNICRSADGHIFVVSNGTFLKWETALRKALELIARQPNLIIDGNNPEICLQLAVMNKGVTDGDKKLITDALQAISVKVKFCVG